ncbi:TetR/AcrR family transcriptional regulator [Sphaerisporangium sp. NPDC005289]|uniref:TetR/AcrR family transcriptional regulator n=1 Tax=Sphaerisporangium sp. NPDC005289 TaxID=3155247 RepID=UPI0033A9EE73
MPKLWNESIDAHRAAVKEAALDATAALVAERGLVALTMSQIAEKAGIGRATLYKYFSDVQAVLFAWHERQVATHLDQLAAAADPAAQAGVRLEAVLRAYAFIQHHSGRHGGELSVLLHHGDHVDRARKHLHDFIEQLIVEGTQSGDLRDDVPAAELTGYCLHALTAAGTLTGPDAVHRLVAITMAGLRPQQPAPAGPGRS